MESNNILDNYKIQNDTENLSSSNSHEESCMEQGVNILNQKMGDIDYIMYRYTFNSCKGSKSDLTDKNKIADISREIYSVVKSKIQTVFYVTGASMGIETHSSKGKLKGEICAEHVHIHFKGSFKELPNVTNYSKKYGNIRDEINKKTSLMMAALTGEEKGCFSNKSCIKWGLDNCIKGDRERASIIKDDPEKIMCYPQKFYKWYSSDKIYNPWTEVNHDTSFPISDVCHWREKAIVIWEESLSKHKARCEIEKNIDLTGWWYNIYEMLDASNETKIEPLSLLVIQYYKTKCSRQFSMKEIAERLKTYMLSRDFDKIEKVHKEFMTYYNNMS